MFSSLYFSRRICGWKVPGKKFYLYIYMFLISEYNNNGICLGKMWNKKFRFGSNIFLFVFVRLFSYIYISLDPKTRNLSVVQLQIRKFAFKHRPRRCCLVLKYI